MKLLRVWANRWRALPALSAGVAAVVGSCARPRLPGRPGAEPELRVAVAAAVREVTVGGQAAVQVSAEGGRAFRLGGGEAVRIRPDPGGIRVTGRRGSGRYKSLTFESTNGRSFVTVNSRPYRGSVEVYARGGAIYAVNRVGVERYLLSVVGAEMGPRAPNEMAALQAQAVVSRTYALKNRGKFRSQGYDLRATTTDQTYRGVEAEAPSVREAVRSTAGMVVSYGGEFVDAFFHSTCGYATADPEEAFRSVLRRPYLRSISDRSGRGYYCDISPHFRWRIDWDGETLRNVLRGTVPEALGIDAAVIDQIRGVRVKSTGPSGRASEIRIEVRDGEIPVFGPDIRRVLQTPEGRSLGSTAIELTNRRSGGRVIQLTAAGAGWGHGVGMCQWGAIGRAREGQDYRTILTTYFPGTKVERWY